MTQLESILSKYPNQDFLIAEDFEDSLVGVDSTGTRLVYSKQKAIKQLTKRGYAEVKAKEFLKSKVKYSGGGQTLPLWIDEKD